jgi:hypothetical protein
VPGADRPRAEGEEADSDYAIRRVIAEVIPPSPAPASDWMGSMNSRIEILGGIVSPANCPPLSF